MTSPTTIPDIFSKVRMEKVTSNEHWGKKGMKDQLSDGGWSNYLPNDEWKLLEFKRNNPIHTKQDCIGKYELLIDEDDFDYMCDYLLSKDAPLFMNNMD
ncbi:hypothetical protein Tco_1220386 [Tanacetum coccineum]